MFGAHQISGGGANGWYDEAALVTAIGGLIAVLLRLRRHEKKLERNAQKLDRNAQKLDRVENTLNHTDQEVTAPDGHQGPHPTLGQRIVALQREVVTGFRQNIDEHGRIYDTLTDAREDRRMIKDNQKRIDNRVTHVHTQLEAFIDDHRKGHPHDHGGTVTPSSEETHD